ncbi:MAG: hypothetical protein IM628_12725 [Phenylobacterium sp.]|uniref:hypothetical protein n=1 Tax=Phenylobacterium sp. TaxID=1871053 RepID=UPI0025D61C5C|nr:hypothetical protein [Phenylobacterium sp.]MCA6305662.1 hypothetical protein [Phenylobacterium sp.]
MTLTVRERILADLYAAIDAVPAVTAYRNRRKPVEAARLPALVLTDGDHGEADRSLTRAEMFELRVAIEGLVRDTTDAAIGPALNALYGQTVAAIMADPTRGGLAHDTIEQGLAVDFDRGEGGQPVASFRLDVTVRYMTRPGDPYTVQG